MPWLACCRHDLAPHTGAPAAHARGSDGRSAIRRAGRHRLNLVSQMNPPPALLRGAWRARGPPPNHRIGRSPRDMPAPIRPGFHGPLEQRMIAAPDVQYPPTWPPSSALLPRSPRFRTEDIRPLPALDPCLPIVSRWHGRPRRCLAGRPRSRISRCALRRSRRRSGAPGRKHSLVGRPPSPWRRADPVAWL